MFYMREEVNDCTVRTPVLFGFGDCRTCSFVTNICAEYDEKLEWCSNFRDEPTCCWECEHIFKCIDFFIEEVWKTSKNDEEFLRAFFHCNCLNSFKEGIRKLRKSLFKTEERGG